MFHPIKSVPYWRLSSFYFFNCAVLGAILPYWGLYLKDLEFTASQIGTVGAVLMATNILAPNVWGGLSDRTGQRMRIIRWGNFAAFFVFLGVFAFSDFVPVLIIIALCSFCWQGLNSQFEVITLTHLSDRSNLYGYIRMWGSIGFVVSVSVLGALLDIVEVKWVPWVVALFLMMTWGSVLIAPAPSNTVLKTHLSDGNIWKILRRSTVWGLFLAVFLLQLSHGPYYTFFSVYLDGLGYQRSSIGLLWSLAVASEVCMFMAMHWLSEWFSLRTLLIASLAIATVRWLMVGFLSDSIWWVGVSQLMHSFTFTAAHVAVVQLIRKHFGDRYQGQGQALYCSFCIGGGAALGAWSSGVLWDWSPKGTYSLAAAASLLGMAVAWFSVVGLNRSAPRHTDTA
ncbi:MFS transporter [Marinimicrobium sp. C6131]|uniref:MFS transporter n=1 Tax=Marinimicrobium sp. C6131 TaxID=3022676 RepID=UPI00223D94FA|nr:MFS transporter [Marinimicrobium sp. C6131]UZJ43997.1 MFS transporter [Marinimicrobium sp. C6131]